MRIFVFEKIARKLQWGVLSLLIVLSLLPFRGLAQETPDFKISGPKQRGIYPGADNQISVAYDSASSDHLYISYHKGKGVLVEKAQYVFKGKKFNLSDLQDYITQKELLKDGIQTTFLEDQTIATQMFYKNDTLRQQTLFYSNRAKHMTFSGDENTLNGEFIMWYPDGQLSFSGNYKNNLKDGVFESFDEAGNRSRKGTYELGKLISGESVVQDLVYDTPEVPAQLDEGLDNFNNYLRMKTADLAAVKEIGEGENRMIDFKLAIHKNGRINKVEMTPSYLNPSDNEIIIAAFKDFTGFKPALLEGVPVRSNQNLSLLLTNKGLQSGIEKTNTIKSDNDSSVDPVYKTVEQMPEFPGKETGLWQFIAQSLRYPGEALEQKIQGKVFVNFVIREDGSVANIAIVRGVHPLLDAEAARVVQQMPKWKPGRHKGKAVRVAYTIPISFNLR